MYQDVLLVAFIVRMVFVLVVGLAVVFCLTVFRRIPGKMLGPLQNAGRECKSRQSSSASPRRPNWNRPPHRRPYLCGALLDPNARWQRSNA